jgi:hypothetical protein
MLLSAHTVESHNVQMYYGRHCEGLLCVVLRTRVLRYTVINAFMCASLYGRYMYVAVFNCVWTPSWE